MKVTLNTLIGYETQKIKVLKEVRRKNGYRMFLVLCKQCGKTFRAMGGNIVCGHTTQCRKCCDANKPCKIFFKVGEKVPNSDWIFLGESKRPIKKKGRTYQRSGKVKCAIDGTIRYVSMSILFTGASKNCGCISRNKCAKRSEARRILKAGDVRYNLRIDSYSHTNRKGQPMYNCTCLVCNESCIKNGAYILKGETKSCSKVCTVFSRYVGFENNKVKLLRFLGRKANYNGFPVECWCKLGNHTYRTYTGNLDKGHGCYCYQKQMASMHGSVNSDWLKMKLSMKWATPNYRERMKIIHQQTWRNQFSSAKCK